MAGIGLAMACAIKVKSTKVILGLHILNTIDKGYSVIITMPDKMSLVCLIFSLSYYITDGNHRRKKQLFVRLVPKLYAHRQRRLGTQLLVI